MKKYSYTLSSLLFLILLVILQSCSTNTIDRTGFMPPVKIRIPRDANQDASTVAFVKSSEKLINALSDRMESIAVHGKDILGKDEEDMSVMDKIQMTKLSVQFFSVSKDLASEMVKMQAYIEKKQKEGISQADMKAYETVEKALEKRINKLNKKYENLFSN